MVRTNVRGKTRALRTCCLALDAVAGVVQSAETSGDERMTDKDGVIRVNRAPVLTL